jgi:hypothetical protein
MKILILGGYGTFGGRLAQLLAPDQRFSLVIAGRSLEKARRYCEGLPMGAERQAVTFDRDSDLEAQLEQLRPDLVVDASGPFQIYGNDPYRVIKACLARRINYMDLADASDFVEGVAQFDSDARAKSLYVLSGVSTFPVLTAAAIRKLEPGLTHIDSVTAGLAPSAYAGVGLNVIRALTSYAGKSVRLVRNGKPATAYGLTETRRYTICPPGYLPLPDTLFSLVDVPDLQLIPKLWPGLDSIWMGAGPVPEVLHQALICMAWLVRIHVLPSLLPFASLFHFVINHLRWGEHRGGLLVAIEGVDRSGEKIQRSWHLIAEGNDGPFIPSMAAQAIILRSLAGKPPAAGARPAMRDLEVADYEELFKTRRIRTGQWERTAATNQFPLYKRLLGDAWQGLPAPLAQMHLAGRAEGTADVTTGRNPLAQLVVALFGFPRAGRNIPVKVDFQRQPEGESWMRDFNGQKFSSRQQAGTGHYDRLLMESFGPATFAMALVFEQGRLKFIPRHWKFLGMPLPLWMAPAGDTVEYAEAGYFCFSVEMKHFLTGLIVRYQGRLKPAG